ncbi:MAG: hypothetical protein ABI112_01780 [Terracoccus sp.]
MTVGAAVVIVVTLVVGGIRMLGNGGSNSAMSASDQLVHAVLARDAVALESLAAPETDPNDTHNRVAALLGRLPAGELAVDRFTLEPTPSATAFDAQIRLTGNAGSPTTVSAGVMADFGKGNDGAGHWYVYYDPAG